MFESFANSERYKTVFAPVIKPEGLRALLIQKDTKRIKATMPMYNGLRALLIQKDTKQLHRLILTLMV